MLRRAAVAVLATLAMIAPADAATLPAGFDDTPVASVPQPTALAFTPDGRLLVTSKAGQLRVLRGGTLLARPAIDLSARVCPQSERGLLGVAAAPDFQVNRHVYLYYTFDKYGTCALDAPPNGPVNRVSRFTLRDDDTIDPASERVLIDGIPSPGGNHNAGHLGFGKDNHLYVTVGDGGCDYAKNSGCGIANDASRDRNVLVGKVLRITAAGGIPADNPFRGANSARCNETGRTAPEPSARRPSPGACATRSGSPSTRTPPAPASSSTTSGRTPGRRSTRARRAPTTAGTCARGTARRTRRPTAAHPRAA